MNIHIFITTMLQLGDKWTNYILFAASASNHTNRIIQSVSQSKKLSNLNLKKPINSNLTMKANESLFLRSGKIELI